MIAVVLVFAALMILGLLLVAFGGLSAVERILQARARSTGKPRA